MEMAFTLDPVMVTMSLLAPHSLVFAELGWQAHPSNPSAVLCQVASPRLGCYPTSGPVPACSPCFFPQPQVSLLNGFNHWCSEDFCFYKLVLQGEKVPSHWDLARPGMRPWLLCRWAD